MYGDIHGMLPFRWKPVLIVLSHFEILATSGILGDELYVLVRGKEGVGMPLIVWGFTWHASFPIETGSERFKPLSNVSHFGDFGG